MTISETEISGAFLIRPDLLEDDRGFFARTYCERDFMALGMETRMVQRSVSWNRARGTLRGMHFQTAPHTETKLVSCTTGEIYDVIIDLRPQSPSYRRWIAITLNARTLEAVYIPAGCAHGFITLENDTTVRYDISEFYAPKSARGVRFDDPAFGVEWPLEPTVISPRDLAFPPYAD